MGLPGPGHGGAGVRLPRRTRCPAALERCRRLGATRIVVVPYFLFTGILVDRIADQVAAWAAAHPDIDVRPGPHLGADPRIAGLVLERYREALAGDAHMNCDLCVYRHALPATSTSTTTERR